MNKQELIQHIEGEYSALSAALDSLTPEQLASPGPGGAPSLRDAVARHALRNARRIALLYSAERNVRPPGLDAMLDPGDAANAADEAAQRDRPFERVLADFHGAQRQLLKRLSAWSEADLFDAGRHAWLRGRSIAEALLIQ